jgi:hypothetical protein
MDECPVDKAIDYCYLINSVAADEDVGESGRLGQGAAH